MSPLVVWNFRPKEAPFRLRAASPISTVGNSKACRASPVLFRAIRKMAALFLHKLYISRPGAGIEPAFQCPVPMASIHAMSESRERLQRSPESQPAEVVPTHILFQAQQSFCWLREEEKHNSRGTIPRAAFVPSRLDEYQRSQLPIEIE